MKKYQVWSEGWQASGQSSKAVYHGEFEGETFKDAVIAFKASLGDPYSRDCVDVEKLTFWGCGLFDNGADAQKAFG